MTEDDAVEVCLIVATNILSCARDLETGEIHVRGAFRDLQRQFPALDWILVGSRLYRPSLDALKLADWMLEEVAAEAERDRAL